MSEETFVDFTTVGKRWFQRQHRYATEQVALCAMRIKARMDEGRNDLAKRELDRMVAQLERSHIRLETKVFGR